MSYLPLIEIT